MRDWWPALIALAVLAVIEVVFGRTVASVVGAIVLAAILGFLYGVGKTETEHEEQADG